MTCRHENADHLKPGECFILWDDIDRPEQIVAEQFRCLDCGSWLSLGRSSDHSVPRDELRLAAMLACHFADDYPCRCFQRKRLLKDRDAESFVRGLALEIAWEARR